MLTITLISKVQKMKIDIQVDTNQIIKTTLETLDENGIIDVPEECCIVYSNRQQRRINAYLTYKQADILNGDIIDLDIE